MTEDIDSITQHQIENKFGNLDALFEIADKDHDGHINAKEARDFFPQFGLPAAFLSVVWKNCVSQPSGMDRAAFTRAMKFMYAEMEKHQTKGEEATPPQESTISPSPPPPPPQSQSSMVNPTMTGQDHQAPYPTVNYVISPRERSNYESHYHQLVGQQSTISGMQAKDFFLQSKLDNLTLKQIWQLADIGRRGLLDKGEFCIAMHLVRLKVKNPNFMIPSQLPPELLPPGKTMPSDMTMMMGFGDDMPNFNGPLTSATPTSEFTTPLHSARGTPTPQGIPTQRTGSDMPSSTATHGFGAQPSYGNVERSNLVIKGARALHDSVQNLINETKDLSMDMFTSQNQVTDRKEQLEQLEKEENELKQKAEDLKEQVEKQRAERVKLDTLLSSFRSKTELLKHEKELFERELTGLTNEINRLNSVKEHGNGSSMGLMREVQELEEQVRYNQQQLIKQRDTIAVSKNSHDSNLKIRNELEHEVTNIKQQLSVAEEQLKGTKTEVEEIKNKIAFFESAKSEYSKATEQTQSQVDVLLRQKQELTKQLDNCKKELAEFEKQFSSTGNKAKHARLVSIVETTTGFLKEFEKLMGEQKEEASKNPAAARQSSTPVSTTSPETGVSSSSTDSEKASTNNFEKGFDDFEKATAEESMPEAAQQPKVVSAASFGFGDSEGFGESVVTGTATNDAKEHATSSAPASAPVETSEFDDGFGVDDIAKTNSLPDVSKKPDELATGTNFDDAFNDFGVTNDDGWGDEFADFKNNNSSTTKSAGLDDFGFSDDFGGESAAKKESKDDWAADFDDFA